MRSHSISDVLALSLATYVKMSKGKRNTHREIENGTNDNGKGYCKDFESTCGRHGLRTAVEAVECEVPCDICSSAGVFQQLAKDQSLRLLWPKEPSFGSPDSESRLQSNSNIRGAVEK